MNQKNYNKLKEVIYEACPKLKLLKPGCILINKQHSLDWAKRVKIVCHNEDNGRFYFEEGDGSIFTQRIKFEEVKDKFKIIGADITLPSVLMAMKKPYTGYKCLEKNSNKIRIVCDDIRIEWDLKEPLDNQTDEVKELLYKLIVEK